jgi:hypothetical protein
VPARLRGEMSWWTLAKDEFPDTGYWPHQLYVRDARRMLGEFIMTQHDLQEHRHKADSIGMGGYNIDIRESSDSFMMCITSRSCAQRCFWKVISACL